MKNLINIGVDKLSELPINSLNLRMRGKDWRLFHKRRKHFNEYHTISGVSPTKIADRIINKYMGKSFNDAFSDYCNKVKWYQQKIFLDNFNSGFTWKKRFTTDENGLIQPLKEIRPPRIFRKEGITFTSVDIEYKYVHKVTGIEKPKYWTVFNKGNYLYKLWGRKGVYYATNKDFMQVVTKGWERHFESANNPEYRRLHAEKLKALRKIHREEKKERKKREYSFISNSEIKLKEEKEIDKYKILAHGFDLVTSFRSEKQTNPDLIKEKQ